MKKHTEIQKYLNECLDLSAYSQANSWVGFMNIFHKEYGFRVAQIGLGNSLVEYLQGLPQTLHMVWTYKDISDLCFNRFEWGVSHTSSVDNFKKKTLKRLSDEKYDKYYWSAMAENIIYLAEAEEVSVIDELVSIELFDN